MNQLNHLAAFGFRTASRRYAEVQKVIIMTMNIALPANFTNKTIDDVSVSINDETHKVTIKVFATTVAAQPHRFVKPFTSANRAEVVREANKVASAIRQQAGL